MKNFFLYGLIGTFGVLVDLSIFNTLYIFFDQSLFMLYHLFGYLFGTLISFFLNINLNFKVKDKIKSRLILFLLVAFLGALTSSVFIYFASNVFAVDARISKLLSLILVFFVQYLLNKSLTFKKTLFNQGNLSRD